MTQETEALLWRGSSDLRAWVKGVADQENTSQNAAMTIALLVAFTLDKKIAPARESLALFDSIRDALGCEMTAWGSFHAGDWENLQALLGTLVAAKLITEPKTKESPKLAKAVAYSFRITRTGTEVLPRFIAILRPIFEALSL